MPKHTHTHTELLTNRETVMVWCQWTKSQTPPCAQGCEVLLHTNYSSLTLMLPAFCSISFFTAIHCAQQERNKWWLLDKDWHGFCWASIYVYMHIYCIMLVEDVKSPLLSLLFVYLTRPHSRQQQSNMHWWKKCQSHRGIKERML